MTENKRRQDTAFINIKRMDDYTIFTASILFGSSGSAGKIQLLRISELVAT
jgi:hypothetical protein